MPTIDQDISLQNADASSGLVHDKLMRSDPIWAALRFEIAKLQVLAADVQAKHNALVAQLITDGTTGVTTAMESSAPVSNL